MPLDFASGRKCLAAFQLKPLFIETLGWDRCSTTIRVQLDGDTYILSAVAEKRGMGVFVCGPGPVGRVPDHSTRRRIERQVAKTIHEHIIVFVDGQRTAQIWQWVHRRANSPAVCREHPYRVGQPGDSLLQKLQFLSVSLEEEETLTLPDIIIRGGLAFDVERVTKRFYDRFKTEHATFLKFLQGIPDEELERWYVSVMLNRLMFIYFIQKKGFLDSDPDYLKIRLTQCKKDLGGDRYYHDFLCPLFFEGFAKRVDERSEKVLNLLGDVPYLNGGIFTPHQIEQMYGKAIKIPDTAFENLFVFFDTYHWHLDERPLKRDDEINPDVLGYIFEKYINQKQMGAYYTKEDITEYITRNTVIPSLFDAARGKCRVAFDGERPVWQLLREDPDRYIYPAVSQGVTWDFHSNRALDGPLPLSPDIADGLEVAKPGLIDRRNSWNRTAPAEVALPTETWREVIFRRKRREEVRAKMASGEVRSVDDLITYNVDIRQFAQDVIENVEEPDLLVAFWKAIESITVLDPTCGSGAFLFAALNILEPLYEACIERMRSFLEEWGEAGEKCHENCRKLFTDTLRRVEEHPNHRYFILKSIIVNTLYGVDIMDEAVEICKLRLFLKLVAQIECVADLEPLPDIDFNIRSGNTLVGLASLHEVKKTQEGTLGFGASEVTRIEQAASTADHAFRRFREMQTEKSIAPADFVNAKEILRVCLRKLTDELDRFLAGEYGINEGNIPNRKKRDDAFARWRESHRPFHWFAEFYGILKSGGFDVIIGNPPYVEYRNVRDLYKVHAYATEGCGDLYAFVMERSDRLLPRVGGRMGMIVPVSITSTDGFDSLRHCLCRSDCTCWSVGFAERPSKLFTGVEKRLTVWLMTHRQTGEPLLVSNYRRWFSEERETLFPTILFTPKGDLPDLVGTAIPKVASPIEVEILHKLSRHVRLDSVFLVSSSSTVYYTRKVRYFVQFFDFVPKIIDAKRRRVEPSELKELHLSTPQRRDIAIAILNSGLFFWFFCAYSDVRNVNRREIDAFRCSIDTMNNQVSRELQRLSGILMVDFKKHAKMLTNDYGKHGQLTIQTFQPRASKPIIDQIDRVLARHYLFTDEEIDFIVNYDIKYRMGQGMSDDSELPE